MADNRQLEETKMGRRETRGECWWPETEEENDGNGEQRPFDVVELLSFSWFGHLSLIFVPLPAWYPRLCRNVDVVMWYVIVSLHRLFYFENWPNVLCHSCVWLPVHLICSVELNAASIKNRLGAYLKQSRVESQFWDASVTRCSVSGGITGVD